jgi:hypothetical protein
MPNQLYVQSVLMRELVCIVAEETGHYFAQRSPRELGKYEWLIDAKDIRETRHEKWWRDVLGPLIESRSFRQPFGRVRDPAFNYDYLEKSYSFEKSIWKPEEERQTLAGFDIKKMFTNATTFVDSKSYILIQAVDILASYCRRSLRAADIDRGILQQVGRLQISRHRDGAAQSMNLLALGDPAQDVSNKKLGRRMAIMTRAARSMWPPNPKDD